MWTCLVLFLLVGVNCQGPATEQVYSSVGTALVAEYMCNGSSLVLGFYETGYAPDEENQYDVKIHGNFTEISIIEFELDDDASIKLENKTYAKLRAMGDHFSIWFYKNHEDIQFTVKGGTEGKIPYFNSVKINGREICGAPVKGSFDRYIQGYLDFAVIHRKKPQNFTGDTCGRRQIDHTELIVNGLGTKPGDWPWHVAIYKFEKSSLKYICGGTLISEAFVLTVWDDIQADGSPDIKRKPLLIDTKGVNAAHCVTIRGTKVVPEILSVVLGKYNLIGGDIGSQEREIYEIIVHDKFDRRYLDNDIALLKLKSEVVFTDYIQPVCVWKQGTTDALPPGDVYGTVVGWGFDQKEALSSQLQMAVIPILQDIQCIRNNVVFYGKVLNGKKFCAGYQNGTSPCNGDSGGGFVVFVPDSNNSSPRTGSWYIRGIVSLTVSRIDVSLCDPEQNAVFTDVAVYKDWINENTVWSKN